MEEDDALRGEYRDALQTARKRVEEGRRHRFELEPELAIACASAPSRCSSVTGLVSHTRAPIARAWERVARSEEHTSELQSLMSISYAAFCLTKKNNRNQKQHTLTLTANTA